MEFPAFWGSSSKWSANGVQSRRQPKNTLTSGIISDSSWTSRRVSDILSIDLISVSSGSMNIISDTDLGAVE
jgi:hypothetical protein